MSLTPEQAAPWLVLLSQHLPEADECGDISCSCGAPLYVGHLPRLLHERASGMVAAALNAAADEIDLWRTNALRAAEMAGDDPESMLRSRCRAASYRRAQRIVRARANT